MKKIFSRRPLTVDPAHMITLHQEAIEQLELMRTVVDASEHASDIMRDTLTRMAENHWEAYLDILHMVCLHDESFAAVMKKHGFEVHDNESTDTEQQQFYVNRLLILALLVGLIRRHRRFSYFYSLRANPMGDYIKESVAMEREHIAAMLGMVQNMM